MKSSIIPLVISLFAPPVSIEPGQIGTSSGQKYSHNALITTGPIDWCISNEEKSRERCELACRHSGRQLVEFSAICGFMASCKCS